MGDAGAAAAALTDSLRQALTSGQFLQIAPICDQLELELAATGEAKPADWPYALHLLGHILLNDLNAARFLWKRTPQRVKDADAELAAAWRVAQRMWQRDRAGVYDAIAAHRWAAHAAPLVAAIREAHCARMFALLSKSYATIRVADVAASLGLSQPAAVAFTTARGWRHDAAAGMLTVHRGVAPTEQKTSLGHLQNLTEYVFHLEH